METNIIQIFLCSTFFIAGTFNLFGKFADDFKRFGYPSYLYYIAGSVEIVGAIGMGIGIWFPIVAVLVGILLGTTMVVAAFTLIIVAKDPFLKAIPSIVLGLLSFSVVILHYINAGS